MWRIILLILPLLLLCLAGCGTPSEDSPKPAALEAEFTPQSPEEGISIVNQTPVLSWTSSVAADTYRLQLSADRNFARPLIDEDGLSSASYSVPAGKLTHDKAYYWRVKASSGGKTSDWSEIWYFKTVFLP